MGEWSACRFLLRNGYFIISHNFRTSFIEIDIIAFNNNTMHFIEVKSGYFGFRHPLNTQHAHRRHKTRKAVGAFMDQYVAYLRARGHKVLASEPGNGNTPVSFDLIWVKSDGLEYFQSIF